MPIFSVRIRRVKFWWHLLLAFFTRYKLRLVLSIFFFTLAIYSLAYFIPVILRNNTIAIGYVGSYSLDTIPAEVLSLATNPLISKDESGVPIPVLASNWTASPDGKTYVVFLKDNLTWHDSTPVEAQNISIAIKDVTITAINNKTLEFKLPNPIASFPLALDKPVFKSQSFYGTGQFRIVKIDQVKDIVKKIVLHPKNNKLPRVDIKFYPTEEQLALALKIGDVKSATLSRLQDLENWPNVTVQKTMDSAHVVTIFLNNENQELASKEFRQALAYALDKSVFVGQAASGPIAKTSWAFNDSIKKYDYNQAKAKELLEKSQIKGPKIILSTIPGLDKISQEIKKSWESVGIQVEIKQEKNIPGDYQTLLAVNEIPPDPDQYALWHSTQKTNITHYKNVKIDKLLEDARSTSEITKRKELYADFQKFLVEDEPAIFLYSPYRYKITYKNSQNLLSKLPSQ